MVVVYRTDRVCAAAYCDRLLYGAISHKVFVTLLNIYIFLHVAVAATFRYPLQCLN